MSDGRVHFSIDLVADDGLFRRWFVELIEIITN